MTEAEVRADVDRIVDECQVCEATLQRLLAEAKEARDAAKDLRCGTTQFAAVDAVDRIKRRSERLVRFLGAAEVATGRAADC